MEKVLISNCIRPPDKDVIDFCADIESVIENATPEFKSFIFLGDTNCRNSLFWSEDKTTTEGKAIKPMFDSLLFHASLKPKIIKVHSYKCMVWDYKRGDYDAFMQLLLLAPCYSCYNSNNINVVVEYFMNMFTSIADICIPHYEATIHPNDNKFMNSDIRHIMNVCDHYWKQYQQTNLDEHHDKFKEMRNKVVYAIRKSKNNIEKKKMI